MTTDQTALVSVIIPTYRSAMYVRRAVESVLAQSHQNFELLLIDDHSDDDTVDVCQSYADKDSRIHIHVRKENGGGAAARNDGINRAKGVYVAFLDADDEWFPAKLSEQLAFMQQNAADLSFTAYERHDDRGKQLSVVRVPHGEIVSYARLLKRNIIGCSTVVVRRSALGNALFPPLRKRQDYGLWLALARGGATIIGLDQVLASYHLRTDSLSASRTDLVKYNWRLYREFEGLSPIQAAWIVGRYAVWHFARKIRERLGQTSF
jgi:teichuronic acid biosynthesis glycosyltransferase TuaG